MTPVKELLSTRNDISLDDKYRKTADQNDLALIKKIALNKNISEEDIHVRAMYLCNDLVDSYYTRFDSADLDAICDMLPGQSVLIGHNKDMAPIARFYHAEKVTRTDKSFMNDVTGRDVEWVKAYFYWPKGTTDGEEMLRKIDTGVWKEISIAWSYKNCECSICGKDMLSGLMSLFEDDPEEEPCRHKLGKAYGDKICHGVVKNITRVLEGSVVFKGGQHHTEFTYVRSDAGNSELNEIAGNTVEFFKAKLSDGNQDPVVDELSLRGAIRLLGDSNPTEPVYYNRTIQKFMCADSDKQLVQNVIPEARFVETVPETCEFLKTDEDNVYAACAAPSEKTPGVYFKPTKPHRKGDESNEYYKAESLKTLEGEYLMSPKYDGIRLTLHKDDDGEVKLFTMGAKEVSAKFPSIVTQARKMGRSFILDGELVKSVKGKRTTHADVSSYLTKKNETDDRKFVFKAFDMVYFEGEDLSDRSLKERIKILNSNISTSANINRVANMTADGGEAVFNILPQISSKEGVVIKRSDSKYNEGRKWYKWKIQSEFTAIVTKREEISEKLRLYTIAVLDENDNRVELGRTFQTSVDAHEGDNIRISVLYIRKKDDGSYRMSEPNVVCKIDEYNEPDSIVTIERIVEAFDNDRASAEKKKCPKCGSSIDADLGECPKCGYKFEKDDELADKDVKCPKCGTTIPAGSDTCPKCGYKLEIDDELADKDTKCPKCGTTIPAGSDTCPKCGHVCKNPTGEPKGDGTGPGPKDGKGKKGKNSDADLPDVNYRVEHHWEVDRQFRTVEINVMDRSIVFGIDGGINNLQENMQRVALFENILSQRKVLSTKERKDLPDRAYALVYTKDGKKIRKLPHHNAKVAGGHGWNDETVDWTHVEAAAQMLPKVKDAPSAKLAAAKSHIDKHLEARRNDKKKKKRTICTGEACVDVQESGIIKVEFKELKRSGLPEKIILRPVKISGNINYYLEADKG